MIPRLEDLPFQVVHNDANDGNVLVCSVSDSRPACASSRRLIRSSVTFAAGAPVALVAILLLLLLNAITAGRVRLAGRRS